MGGGGHRNAAGAFAQAGLDQTLASVLESAPRFLKLDESSDSSELSAEDADYLAMLGGG